MTNTAPSRAMKHAARAQLSRVIIGEIDARRKAAGVPIRDLAIGSGLTKSTTHRILTGETKLFFQDLVALAQGLGMRASELVLPLKTGYVKTNLLPQPGFCGPGLRQGLGPRIFRRNPRRLRFGLENQCNRPAGLGGADVGPSPVRESSEELLRFFRPPPVVRPIDRPPIAVANGAKHSGFALALPAQTP